MYLSIDWIISDEPNMSVFVFLFHLVNINKTHFERGKIRYEFKEELR